MRNHSFLVLVLLLVVDGVKSVSVMQGDSVTLHTGLTGIQTNEDLRWKFPNDTIIARIDGETNKIRVPGNISFEGRLKLNEKTGSLTIKNIKTTDSRVYKLQISNQTWDEEKEFSVTVRVNISKKNFGTISGLEQVIGLNSADYKWRNTNRNSQTGDLNIRNIPNDQAGVYEVEINTGSVILHRKFRITLNNVFSDDGVKKMSVKKGESVTLQTEIIHIPDDVIVWTFGPQDTDLIKAHIKNNTLRYNKDEMFKDRLQLNFISGDLTVKNIKPEMSGLYKVKIIKRTYTLQKIFSVTVDDPHQFSGSKGTGVSVNCGAGVVLVCAAAVFLLQGV